MLTLWSVAVQQHVLFGPAHKRPQPPAAGGQRNGDGDAIDADALHDEDDEDEDDDDEEQPQMALLAALLRHVAALTAASSEPLPPALGPALQLLLSQALAWLLWSPRPDVRAAAAGCVLGLPARTRSGLSAAWLSAHSAAGPPGPTTTAAAPPAASSAALPPRPAVGADGAGRAAWCAWHAASWYLGLAAPGGAGEAEAAAAAATWQARRQLAQASQGLGMDARLSDRLQEAPIEGLRHAVRAEEEAEVVRRARALLPAFCVGPVVALPKAGPRPLAVVVAPPATFARGGPRRAAGAGGGEPLGALFTCLTLLGDAGWRAALLDARVWAGLRGREEKQQFVRALLGRWGVQLASQREDGSDDDDDDSDEEEER